MKEAYQKAHDEFGDLRMPEVEQLKRDYYKTGIRDGMLILIAIESVLIVLIIFGVWYSSRV